MAEKLLFAHSTVEALTLKNTESAYLAGGTEINRLHSSVDAPVLISIRRIDVLKTVTSDGDTVMLGAAVTFQQAIEHPLVPDWFKEACRMMASRTKRNMATVGGNIALLRDDSYIIPALLAGRATLVCADAAGSENTVSVGEYMTARREGKLADTLIIRVGLPVGRRVFVKRYANTAMSHSVLNIAYGVSAEGKDISIGIAAKNCGLFEMERLAASFAAASSAGEEEIVSIVDGSDIPAFTDDMFGTAAYKRYLLGATLSKMVSLSR